MLRDPDTLVWQVGVAKPLSPCDRAGGVTPCLQGSGTLLPHMLLTGFVPPCPSQSFPVSRGLLHTRLLPLLLQRLWPAPPLAKSQQNDTEIQTTMKSPSSSFIFLNCFLLPVTRQYFLTAGDEQIQKMFSNTWFPRERPLTFENTK